MASKGVKMNQANENSKQRNPSRFRDIFEAVGKGMDL